MQYVNSTLLFKSFIVSVVLILLLAVPYTSGAATNTISTLTSSFIRTSTTSAEVEIFATCLGPSKIVSAVTREIYDENEGDYVTDSSTYRKTKYNATSITHRLTLPVQANGDYRIKIQITDTYNDITTTVTCYEYLQDLEEDVVTPIVERNVMDCELREGE